MLFTLENFKMHAIDCQTLHDVKMISGFHFCVCLSHSITVKMLMTCNLALFQTVGCISNTVVNSRKLMPNIQTLFRSSYVVYTVVQHHVPAHFKEEAISPGHPFQFMFVLLQEISVTFLWDKLQQLQRCTDITHRNSNAVN